MGIVEGGRFEAVPVLRVAKGLTAYTEEENYASNSMR